MQIYTTVLYSEGHSNARKQKVLHHYLTKFVVDADVVLYAVETFGLITSFSFDLVF